MAAVGLAIGPNWGGRYDPAVAVLTATLVAVIWYTYFTYRSVNREEPTLLLTDVRGLAYPKRLDVELVIENRSRRSVRTRQILEIWVDRRSITQGGFYSGREDLHLGPHDAFSRSFSYDSRAMGLDVTEGETAAANYEVHVRLTLFWHDDLKEEGRVGPRHWYAILATGPAIGPIIGKKHVDHLFGGFPSAAIEPPGGWSRFRSAEDVSA